MNQPNNNDFNSSHYGPGSHNNTNLMIGQSNQTGNQIHQNQSGGIGDNRRMGLHRQGSMGPNQPQLMPGQIGYQGVSKNNSFMGPNSGGPMDQQQSGLMGPVHDGSWPISGLMGRMETHGSSKLDPVLSALRCCCCYLML